MSREERRPLIFDIHHSALDDGPGIRTTVSFKGCPLSCIWCSDPESISDHSEIAFFHDHCKQCGDCTTVCSERAIKMETGTRIIRNWCSRCGECSEICPSTAIKTIGKYYSVDDLIEILIKNKKIYETSGGGVTFSGGEPTLHMDYLAEVLKILRMYKIHVALQTSGMFELAEFRSKLLPYIDLVYYDIKLFNSEKHKLYTGVNNWTILYNFVELAKERDINIVLRVPLIPNITAIPENLKQIAEFLKINDCSLYELLPYNPGGLLKNFMVGRNPHSALSVKPLSTEEENRLRAFFQESLNS